MKQIKLLIKVFFNIFLITGFVACNINEEGFEDSKLNSFLEGDDELILAISKSKSKHSINIDQLPLSAKSTIDTDYSSMSSENSYEAPKLGYEVNMRGVLPTNLGEKEDVFFAKNGRELISKKSFKDYDKSGKEAYEGEKKGKRPHPFRFVYPVSFTMPDGISVTVNNKEDIKSSLKSWYDANPDSKEKPELVFPVDVIIKSKDGEEILTISSKEEMQELRKKFERKKSKPFELVFPISFNMPDGTVISGEDHKEIKGLMKDWYDANPDSKEKPELVFPVDVIIKSKDGEETLTISSKEEMHELRKKYKRPKPFELVFPISFTMPDGTIISGEDHKEIKGLIKDWYDANPDLKEKPELVFPVDVIIKSKDGEETLTISSKEEMQELRKKFKTEKPKNRGPRKPKRPRTKD